MKVRVLGCSGGIGGLQHRTTSLLVDDDILIDCGTGLSVLEFEQLLRIDDVFITHSHLDHIALLPLLVDTVGDFRGRPIRVHASAETLRILQAHIFNWLVWPDFTSIPDRENPFLSLHPMALGEVIELGGRRVQSLPASHAVPAVGYCVSAGGGSLAFSGDTGTCDALVDALNGIEDLRYFIVETAFPDSMQDLALAARHLCPSMLQAMLARLRPGPQVLVTHLKPGMSERILAELADRHLPTQPAVLANDQCFEL